MVTELSFEETVVLSLSQVWLFCNPMDCSPHSMGFFQTRILEWVAISRPRDRTCVSYSERQILHHWASWKAFGGNGEESDLGQGDFIIQSCIKGSNQLSLEVPSVAGKQSRGKHRDSMWEQTWHPHTEFSPDAMTYSTSPQPDWHEGPVSWKTVLPWIGGGGAGGELVSG